MPIRIAELAWIAVAGNDRAAIALDSFQIGFFRQMAQVQDRVKRCHYLKQFTTQWCERPRIVRAASVASLVPGRTDRAHAAFVPFLKSARLRDGIGTFH